jgi:hypothetical protein
MIRLSFIRPALAVLAGVILMMGLVQMPSAAATVKNKKPAGKTAKFIRGSEESPKARIERLKRECKGRVNAGACEGYTQ